MRSANAKSALQVILLTAAAFLSSGSLCDGGHRDHRYPRIPAKPTGPTLVTRNVTADYATVTTDPDRSRIMYTFDWGDGTGDTIGYCESGDTATARHKWRLIGEYPVKALAIDESGKRSADWSDTLNVTVDTFVPPNHRPDTPTRPTHTGVDSVLKPIAFSTSATDPDGDSVRIKFYFGDGEPSDYGPWVASGATFTDTVVYQTNGWHVVYAVASDERDTSAWSAPDSMFIHSPPSPRSPRP